MGFTEKKTFREGVQEKPIKKGDCLKRGHGQFGNLRGGAWQERGGGVFEGGGGWYPNAHYENAKHSHRINSKQSV